MRNFLVPEFWLTAKISSDALRTAIAVGMHRSKEGISFVKNEQLVEMVGKNIRQIQVDLTNCEKAGLFTKKFDETGKRYFVFNMIKSTGAAPQHPAQPDYATPRSGNAPPSAAPQHPQAQSDNTPRRSATALPPDNPPYMSQSTIQSTIQSTHTQSEPEPAISHPQPEPFECVLGNGKKLPPLKLPEQKIPDDLLAIATATNLEGWLGHVQNAGIDVNDWRVRKTLIEVRSKSKKINAPGSYAWTIFDALPEQKPEAETFDPQVKNGFRKPTLEEAQKEFDDFIEFAKGSK